MEIYFKIYIWNQVLEMECFLQKEEDVYAHLCVQVWISNNKPHGKPEEKVLQQKKLIIRNLHI